MECQYVAGSAEMLVVSLLCPVGESSKIPEIRHFLNLARPLQSLSVSHPEGERDEEKGRYAMFSIDFSALRQAFVSIGAALLVSGVIVGAAVLPAQTATAAVLGL